MHADFLLESYDYKLPERAIAQYPSHPAHQAKMLVLSKDPKENSKKNLCFFDLIEKIDHQYLLFLNRSKVFKARIPLKNTKIIRKSGKEVLLEE